MIYNSTTYQQQILVSHSSIIWYASVWLEWIYINGRIEGIEIGEKGEIECCKNIFKSDGHPPPPTKPRNDATIPPYYPP